MDDLDLVYLLVDEIKASANWLKKWIVLPGLIIVIIIIGGVIISTVI